MDLPTIPHERAARGALALCLALNLVSYLAWGSAALPSPDLVVYVKNHVLRELTYGLALTLATAWLLRRPLSVSTAGAALFLSGASVLGFWIGRVGLGGLGGLDRIFPGSSARVAFALHGPQLVLWLLALALGVRGWSRNSILRERSE